MKRNKLAMSAMIAVMLTAPVERAMADGDAIVGGIIGGIIGGAIVNEGNRKRAQKPRTVYRQAKPQRATPSMSSAQREQNREVQTALNYFNFPVGTPDGSIGPRSRSAISQYQATLGYAPTGQLTEYERTILVTSYSRALAGGPVIAQTITTHPMGVRGLLLTQRDEMAGVIQPQQPGVVPQVPVVAAIVPLAPPVVEPAATLPILAAAPEPVAEPALSALPSFIGNGASQVSLASQCNKVSLMTNTNGGYITAANMVDANFALSEQFCLARTYAMTAGEELAAAVPGFTPVQITEQCKAFGPVLADYVASMSVKTRDEVLQGVSGFVLSSGMAPAQLAATAKICLGVGYTTDQMDVAVGSALLLTALGEKAYGELLGHHLSQGFGATKRPDLSMAWYEMGLEANAAGQRVFAPGLPDRGDVIRKAAFAINGRGDAGTTTALPVFATSPDAAPLPSIVVDAPSTIAQTDTTAAPAPGRPAVPPTPIFGSILSTATKLFE